VPATPPSPGVSLGHNSQGCGIAEFSQCGKVVCVDELTQLSRRGTVTLPVAVRRKLGLAEGDVLTVRLAGRSIVLTPAVLTPVELYTDERLAEFEQNEQLTEAELAAARRTWQTRTRRG